jgi:2-hydroxychromene-2-carboxylate isomerase
MRRVEFWFEFGSTYSYPAVMRIEREARARGVELSWKAFLLGPIFSSQGWRDSPFNIYPAKGRYMWRDMERVCAAQGLALRRSTVFPRNGLTAARLCLAHESQTWLPAFVREVFLANFAEDREIADLTVLSDCLDKVGVSDVDAALARSATAEVKAALRRRTEQAEAAGIFGAPSFLSSGELFWGNDRLEAALEWGAA